MPGSVDGFRNIELHYPGVVYQEGSTDYTTLLFISIVGVNCPSILDLAWPCGCACTLPAAFCKHPSLLGIRLADQTATKRNTPGVKGPLKRLGGQLLKEGGQKKVGSTYEWKQ